MRMNIEIDDDLMQRAIRSTGARTKKAVVAISALKPQELEELYSWLDQNCPQPIDTRLQSDLAAGRLDKAIHRALDDEKNDRVQPL